MNNYHHGNLKQLLLEEGIKLLAEEGYNNFSLRKLARRCRVSHTSPYRHFSDRNELILAIARDVQDKFNTALRDALNSTEGTQTEKILAMGRGYVHFFLENPDFLELLFLTPELWDLSCGKHDHSDGSSLETYLAAVFQLLAERDSDFEGFSMDPSHLDGRIPGEALRPWCLVHGLTVLLVKKALPVSDPKAVDQLISQVLSV